MVSPELLQIVPCSGFAASAQGFAEACQGINSDMCQKKWLTGIKILKACCLAAEKNLSFFEKNLSFFVNHKCGM